jgi:phosphate transport system protein
MAEYLHRQLQQLKDEIVYVGALVETALAKSIMALRNRDSQLAREVIDADAQIDGMEVTVERDCLNVLALHQPVALDLRFVVAVLKINNDLERIGDLAKNIAKRVLSISNAPTIVIPTEFAEMAGLAQAMVKQSLDALVTANVALARQVRSNDDEVDALRDQIEATVMAEITRQPDLTGKLLKVASVARHLERLADMATHIAEEVIYMVEGSIVRHRAGA